MMGALLSARRDTAMQSWLEGYVFQHSVPGPCSPLLLPYVKIYGYDELSLSPLEMEPDRVSHFNIPFFAVRRGYWKLNATNTGMQGFAFCSPRNVPNEENKLRLGSLSLSTSSAGEAVHPGFSDLSPSSLCANCEESPAAANVPYPHHPSLLPSASR